MMGAGAGARGNSPLGSLLGLVGYLLFVLFIRRTASYLGDRNLAASAGRFLVFAMTAFLGLFLTIIAAAVAQAFSVVALVAMAAIVVALVAFVWFLRLIISLRTTIDQRLGA
jgi:FtsH-binding integral membrane protein